MNELLPINYDTEEPTVSARELHEALEVKTRFNDWFQRMTEYGFEEKKDYYSKMSKTSELGGRPATDYEITFGMAKEICMLQRTEKGKLCRQYFIDLEKAWNTPEQIMARALKMADKAIISLKDRCNLLDGQVVEQQKLISQMRPKADYLDRILSSKSLVATTQIAKDYGYSATAFNKILRELGVQFKVNKQWVLYAKYQNLGYTHSRTINITRSDNRPDVVMQTEWTQKGRLFLYDLLRKNGIYPTIEKPIGQYSFGGV